MATHAMLSAVVADHHYPSMAPTEPLHELPAMVRLRLFRTPTSVVAAVDTRLRRWTSTQWVFNVNGQFVLRMRDMVVLASNTS